MTYSTGYHENTGKGDGAESSEVAVLGASVFLIPGTEVKNGDDHLVVLNRTAKAVVESVRGQHDTHVFTCGERPLKQMNNWAWQRARERTGLSQVRMHDLKHTFGQHLRAAGVSFEDRQDLLGHRSGKITPITAPLSFRT